MSDLPTWAIWLALGLVALAVEAMSLDFVLLYFGIGALVAAVVSALGLGAAASGAVFVVSSIALLAVTRPALKRFAHRTSGVATNVDTIAGKRGIVTITIDNDASTGQIRIGTEYWTARATHDDGRQIPAGATVYVEEVTGVTARVWATGERI